MQKISLLLLGITFACTSNKPIEGDSSAICKTPVAEAGDDVVVSLGMPAVLNGASSSWCSDYDEDVVFTWSFVSVPSESSVNENSLSVNRSAAAVTPTFTPDVTGEYVLSLQVNDGIEASNIDYVVVNVAAGDSAPVADCGGSYEGEIGSVVTIDGSLSTDPELAALEYSWGLTPPNCSTLSSDDLYNEGTANPSFVPDCEGVYAVSLSVSDGAQWSDPVICSVEVGSANRLPVADAGKTGDLGGCADNPMPLNGLSSYDPDGDTLTFSWAVVSVPTNSVATNASFDDQTSGTPRFTWDVEGTYTFQLQVYDGSQWSAPDLVDITIGSLMDNRRPIANAGDDLDIEITAACQEYPGQNNYSGYSSDCSSCASYTLLLDGSGSTDLDGDSMSFQWEEATGGLQIVTPNAAVTSAIIGSQAVNTNLSYSVELTAADCERSDTDSMSITYSCVAD